MSKTDFFRWLSRVGVVLTVIGSLGLLSGFIGLIDFDDYAFGLSAGIRVLGSIAIAGCLLGAIASFALEDQQ